QTIISQDWRYRTDRTDGTDARVRWQGGFVKKLYFETQSSEMKRTGLAEPWWMLSLPLDCGAVSPLSFLAFLQGKKERKRRNSAAVQKRQSLGCNQTGRNEKKRTHKSVFLY